MDEGEDRLGGNVVDDVSLSRWVGGVDNGAYVGREVDIGDYPFPVMEPDGHEKLHVPAGVADTVFVHFVKAVAPVFPFKDAASVASQGTCKGAA